MADPVPTEFFARDWDLLVLVAHRLVPPGLRHRFRESDLVQETLLIALKQRDRLGGMTPDEQTRYLCGVLRRVAQERVRNECRRRRDPRREERLSRYTDTMSERLETELSDRADDPAAALERLELWRSIAAAVARLPEQQRNVFESHFLDGLSHAETASRLGLTPGQVKHALRSGVSFVRAALNADRGEQS